MDTAEIEKIEPPGMQRHKATEPSPTAQMNENIWLSCEGQARSHLSPDPTIRRFQYQWAEGEGRGGILIHRTDIADGRVLGKHLAGEDKI